MGNQRQERVRGLNETEKRSKVAKISHLVMDVVSSMANSRILWQPTGTELMERMSQISGVSIDSDWFERHRTMRQKKDEKERLLLMYEAAGGRGMNTKSAEKLNALSARHLRGSTFGANSIMDIDDLDVDVRRSSARTSKGIVKKESLLK